MVLSMTRLLEFMRTLIFVIICGQSKLCIGETITNVQNVLEDFFSPSVYNKEIIGKKDLTETLEVNLSFSLVYIKRLDEIEERIHIFGVLFLEWKDERLIWDPKLYNDTYDIWMTVDKVWRPEISLENPSTSGSFFGDITRLKSFHKYNGEASLVIGDMFDCTCSIDLTSFPWDKQTCTINFIVSGYLSTEVKLTGAQNEIDLESYHSNGIWTLLSTKVYSKSVPLKSLLVFEMVLQRRPVFFVVNVLLPITILGVLQLFVFKVPIESGERISFSLTVLLSISDYMTLISDNLPPSAESMAAMCYLILFIMIESALICLCNIVSVSLYHKRTEDCKLSTFWYKFVNMFGIKRCYSKARKVDIKSDIREVDGDVEKEDTASKIHVSRTIKEQAITWKDVSRAFDLIVSQQ